MSVKDRQYELDLDDRPNHDEVHYANVQLRLHQRQQEQQMRRPVRQQHQQQQQQQENPTSPPDSVVMADALRIGAHAHPLMRVV